MELLRALGALAEDAGLEQRRIAKALGIDEPLDPADHAELFDFALYPYASVYLGAEGMLGGEARDRIAGFWRALGAVPPEEPDHLATLLAFYAQLVERSAAEDDVLRRVAIERARAAFFWEHLASWLPQYLSRARELGAGAYARWAALLEGALEAEAAGLPYPRELPLHLRQAPAFAPAFGDDEDTIEQLLAPVRTGVILVRADLRRVASALGTALRQGERRYALRALFEADRVGALRELALTAERAAERHATLSPVWGSLAGAWVSRARATAERLAGLATP